MRIGKVVSSRSHVDVLCQIDKPHESERPPGPADITFGRFVMVGESTVGLLYDSQLQNPDFGNYGPRLSSPAQVGVFTPDYFDEQATLVSVLLLGGFEAAGGRQGVPHEVVPIHAEVRLMDDAEILRFHQDPATAVQVRYVPMVLSHAGAVAAPLLMGVLDRLAGLFPQDRPRIEVLRKALLWQTTMNAIR
ncbi:hypothetical protein D3C87_876920 [compost metagenome]